MSWLDFIASVIQSLVGLAWPAALFGAVWLFRKNIAPLLPMLRLRYKDTEVSFRLEQAEKEAAKLPEPIGVPPPTPEEASRFEQLAELSPRAAVLEMRASLEQGVREFATTAGVSNASKLQLPVLVRLLREQGLIDGHTSALLDDLRAMGNEAAHGASVEITPTLAKRVGQLTEAAMSQLTHFSRGR